MLKSGATVEHSLNRLVVITMHASTQSLLPAILGRASVAGLCAGGISGLIAGTAVFPIVGTGGGAIVGVVVGLVFGVVNGMVLAGLARWTHSRPAFGVVAAVTSGLCAVPLAAAVSGGWQHVFVAGSGALVFVCWCVLLGAVLAPAGAPSNRPGWAADLRWCAMIGRCAGCGAVAGLIAGFSTYPSTAVAALVEGAIFAAGPGAVVGATVGLARSACPSGALR